MATSLPPLDLGNELWQKRRHRNQTQQLMNALQNRVQALLHQEQKQWKNIKKNQRSINQAIIQKEASKLDKMQKFERRLNQNQNLEEQQLEHQMIRKNLDEQHRVLGEAEQKEKRKRFLKLKHSSLNLERQLLQKNNEEYLNKQLSGNQVKENKLSLKLRNKKRQAKLENEWKDSYRREIQKEEGMMERDLEIIRELEQVESQLMRRLEQTKAMSQNVEVQMKDIQETQDLEIDDKIPAAYSLNQKIKKEYQQYSQSSSHLFSKQPPQNTISQSAYLPDLMQVSRLKKKQKKKQRQ